MTDTEHSNRFKDTRPPKDSSEKQLVPDDTNQSETETLLAKLDTILKSIPNEPQLNDEWVTRREDRSFIQLIINPEYLNLVPRPTPQEYHALEQDIIEKGEAHTPIIINQHGVILDGHTRYKICTEHGSRYRCDVRRFDSNLDEKLFVITSNLTRRHLTDMQKIIMAKPLEALIAEKAKRQQGRRTDLASCSNEQKVSPVDTALEVAKQIGVSRASYVRGKKIRDEGTPREIQEALSKPRQISRVANKIRKRLNLEHAHAAGSPPMPDGFYDIIYADPPWRYDSEVSQRGKADNHYATMTTGEICDVDVPSAGNALLFLWVTSAHIPDALRVIKAWGFEFVTSAVWVKDRVGLGWFFRGQHEQLFLARKGKMPHPEDKNRYSTVIKAPRERHSAKPQLVYEMIEKMYPNRRYLELFSRNKRPGWTMWGLETPESSLELSPVERYGFLRKLGEFLGVKKDGKDSDK